MKRHHSLAVVMGATSALSLIAVSPASAHETSPTATVTVTRPGAPLLGTFSSVPLQALRTWATALRARVAAVPDSTVLTGRSRTLAVAKLAGLARLDARLAALGGLTPEEQTQVRAIRATLAATAADLRALLANRPVARAATRPVAHVSVVRSTRKAVTATATTSTRHHCDGTFDWSRYDGSRYDGYRWWDRYHRR